MESVAAVAELVVTEFLAALVEEPEPAAELKAAEPAAVAALKAAEIAESVVPPAAALKLVVLRLERPRRLVHLAQLAILLASSRRHGLRLDDCALDCQE